MSEDDDDDAMVVRLRLATCIFELVACHKQHQINNNNNNNASKQQSALALAFACGNGLHGWHGWCRMGGDDEWCTFLFFLLCECM